MYTPDLDGFAGYMLALLHMMDDVGRISLQDALHEFEHRYGKHISEKEKKQNPGGRIRWMHQVEWARNDLAGMGLMGSDGRGIWTITENGRTWLRAHPNDRAELLTMDREYRSKYRTGDKSMGSQSIRWKGKIYHVDSDKFLAKAKQVLAAGAPPEAMRFNEWYAEIDGQQVSVKWLFHLMTGAGYLDFVSTQAASAVKKVGIPVGKLKSSEKNGQAHRAKSGSRLARNQAERDERAKIFKEIMRVLPDRLPPFAQHGKIKLSSNYLQVVYPEFHRSHYELILSRNDEFAFHFESGNLKENLARLEQAKEFQSTWKEQLDPSLTFSRWGEKRAKISIVVPRKSHMIIEALMALYENHAHALSSTSMEALIDIIGNSFKEAASERPFAEFWETKALAYANLMARFIEVTFRGLEHAFPPLRRQRRSRPRPGFDGADENAHRLLDAKIMQIRHFLEGRSTISPPQETLCDWIQLAYFLELFSEGQQLFSYVSSDQLKNDWLYRRTKRYADVCRINVTRRAT
jgi:hypothetical protein